ncbi:flagellar hook-length control protein FliK [Alkaliphilus sp. MSJ-5]|uniref:Flagellar hook-length control protein FliK n=1 Tax=Alkaliphilus flagellatus TaxID=2841507 RepID=A0ABS6G6S6_9FIRM|nr:flagellar hook-length control protein FliK [Alkaliphilus flagellatus]MBU5677417.1 flagellar hook-length control protein FliK [Alkaliphilus flagellatus]
MMNIAGIHNLLSQKNTIVAKDQISTDKDKQLFSDVFDNEKKSLIFKRQDKKTQAVNNSQNATNNTSKQVESSSTSSSNKASNKETKPTNKDNKVLDSKENGQLELEDGESIDKDKDELLDHILSLLQSLIASIQVDISKIEDGSKVDRELSIVEMESLADLNNQLNLLLDTIDIEAGELLKENIDTTLSTITRLADQTLLDNKDIIFTQNENVSEVLSNLEELKNNIELALTNVNSAKNNDPQKLEIKSELDLVDEETKNISENDTAIVDAVAIDEEGNTEAKKLYKQTPPDAKEKDDFFKQHERYEDIIINDNVLVSQQEKFDQKINVRVIKNEIIDPKQFVGEIAQKAGAFLSKDRNEMSIQLTPENLGKISIKIGLNDGTLTGKIYAENYSVKEIIETNLNQLRDALEEKGLSISGLEVHVGDNSQNFGSRLFQSRLTNKQKSKEVSTVSNNTFLTLEQEVNEKNPYLVSSQFDGLV